MYEFTSHHRTEDAALETRMKAAFRRHRGCAQRINRDVQHRARGQGQQVFTARFKNLDEAQAFRAALTDDAEADAHLSPRLEDLTPQTADQIEAAWSVSPQEVAAF